MVAHADDATPPNDIAVERRLIGALLQDPERTLRSARSVGVSIDDFYSPQHADIWRAAISLDGRGTVPEAQLLAGHLRDTHLEPLADLLREINAESPDHLYPYPWAERVREKGARRGLYYFGRKVADLGTNGTPAAESIEHARRHLDFLAACYRPAEQRFGWTTGADLLAEPEEDESAHLWLRIVVPGALTLVAGAPKAGKSYLLYALAGELTRGGRWAGRAVPKTGVVILSEEGRRTIRRKVKRFGVEGAVIMPRSGVAPGMTWPEVCQAAGEKATAIGAGLLIVDTFSHWADLAPDDEQKEGPIRRALQPAQAVADTGLAVVVAHHLGKSGRIRGSTALEQVPDVLVEVSAFGEPDRPERALSIRGRFEEPMGEVVVRYVLGGASPDTYEFVGSARNARASGMCEPVAKWLLEEHAWVTGAVVAAGVGGRKADVLAALDLMAGSRIQRIGRLKATRYAALDVPVPVEPA